MIDPRKKAIAGRIILQSAPVDAPSDQMQSQSFKRKILDMARSEGSFRDLYWCIEFRAPARLVPSWVKARKGGFVGSVVFNAAHPGKWVPVVPIAPDPQISQEYAEILKEWMRSRNRWVQEIGIAITTPSLLKRWYEWGDRLPAGDEFCSACGGVGECVCDTGRLALVAGYGVVHLSRGGQRALCGRCVQGARWVSPLTTWERRRLGDGVCKNCERIAKL